MFTVCSNSSNKVHVERNLGESMKSIRTVEYVLEDVKIFFQLPKRKHFNNISFMYVFQIVFDTIGDLDNNTHFSTIVL